MKRWQYTLLLMAVLPLLSMQAQLRVTKIERLPLSPGHRWTMPVFNQQGSSVFFTEDGYNGIWEYSIAAKSCRQIVDEPRSGLDFAVSPDGNQIAYRKTVNEGAADRVQTAVQLNLRTGAQTLLQQGRDIPAPVFDSRNTVRSPLDGPDNAAPNAAPVLLGMDRTKIALSLNGKTVDLDPFQGGSYIWPSLSPDKQRILAYEMGRGAFTCDLTGSNIVRLGRCDAPSWTRDGNWIVYMADKDDGRRIISSDLMAVSADGKTTVQLTATPDVLEMHPKCSMTDNSIVCAGASGEIFILTYEVAQ
jgi:Tol biopolymer transport system component